MAWKCNVNICCITRGSVDGRRKLFYFRRHRYAEALKSGKGGNFDNLTDPSFGASLEIIFKGEKTFQFKCKF